jgi:DNA-binding PadR family transcriptional regulator
MKRKKGTLTPIEVGLLRTAMSMHATGTAEWHGFQLAKEHEGHNTKGGRIGFGSLYRALDRMESFGYLTSHLEDEAIAAEERRPRRRLYAVTGLGQQALAIAEVATAAPALKAVPGGVPA